MSQSTFGKKFTVTTWGESHGKALGTVVDGCVTVRIWQKINDAVDNVVDNITLADLVEWQNEKKEN